MCSDIDERLILNVAIVCKNLMQTEFLHHWLLKYSLNCAPSVSAAAHISGCFNKDWVSMAKVNYNYGTEQCARQPEYNFVNYALADNHQYIVHYIWLVRPRWCMYCHRGLVCQVLIWWMKKYFWVLPQFCNTCFHYIVPQLINLISDWWHQSNTMSKIM